MPPSLFCFRRYMAEILPIWRKTLSNQSINLGFVCRLLNKGRIDTGCQDRELYSMLLFDYSYDLKVQYVSLIPLV